MSKKFGIIILVIAAVALCLSIANLICMALRPAGQETQDVQYVLYLGTNDKDTNEPVFSQEEARAKAEEILIKHFGGYTIQDANRGWEDNGTRYREYTLVIYVSDTTPEQIHAVADDMIRIFNQSSVLIQENQTVTEFYSGAD